MGQDQLTAAGGQGNCWQRRTRTDARKTPTWCCVPPRPRPLQLPGLNPTSRRRTAPAVPAILSPCWGTIDELGAFPRISCQAGAIGRHRGSAAAPPGRGECWVAGNPRRGARGLAKEQWQLHLQDRPALGTMRWPRSSGGWWGKRQQPHRMRSASSISFQRGL